MNTTHKSYIWKNSFHHLVCLCTYGLIVIILLMINGCDNAMVADPVKETGTVTDIEGNVYNTIKIGNQWWMAENLKVTTFSNGESILNIEEKEDWKNTTQAAYSLYNNLSSGLGLLYNFYVVMHESEIAPEGWRVPTDEDWKELEEYVGMPVSELDKTNWRGTTEGDQLKELSTSTTGWIFYKESVWGTNATGFTADAGSCRVFNGEWGVPALRHSGFWWTSSVQNGYGWYRYLDYKKSGIFRYTAHPNYGFSIRCIKE